MAKSFIKWCSFGAFSLLCQIQLTHAQIEPAGDDEDPQGIANPEKTGDRLATQKKRDWNKHPGFFHYGLVVQANFMTAGGDVTGAAGGVNGFGMGGMAVLDYDYSRTWLFGFRFMAGYKRLFLTSDGTIPEGINAFPISIAIQKLKRLSPLVTLRYGVGVAFEIHDTASEIRTDNNIFVTLDFDFPHFLTGLRGQVYKFDGSQNFLGAEAIAGVRF